MSLDSAIASLVSRLETITARLETVEKQIATGGGSSNNSSSSQSSSSSEGSSASVQAYDALINQHINLFVELSGKLGAPEVAEQAALVAKAVQAQKQMLIIAASSKKPSQEVIQKLLQPTSDLMAQIAALRDAKRSSKFFNHLSTVSEGIPALGWVVVSPTPGPHVNDMRAGSEFYSNRILKDFKGKDQIQVDWVNSFNGFLKDLTPFIKQYHTTGLEWNPKGGDASSASVSTSSSSAGGPPPPPPVFTESSDSNSKKVDNSQLFAALSKGTDVTKGLKKVTNDMKTKNRAEDQKSSIVPAKEVKITNAPKTGKEVAKPPKLSLEGSKWQIEHQVNNKSIVISETEAKQTVYLFKCVGSVVQIKGKINAITLDNCTRTSVVFENLVSSCDIVNCTSVEVQVTGKVPSISIDKTSGCQLYIGKHALDTEIFTSKSSEMNILIPGASEDADLVEIAVPEQYRTTIKGGKLITETNSHV